MTCRIPLALLHHASAKWHRESRGLFRSEINSPVRIKTDCNHSGGLLLKMEGRCGEVRLTLL